MGRNPTYKAVKFIDSTHEVLRSYNKPKTSKRKRTKLSDEQLNILEESYRMNHHPSAEVKESMASKIGIPVKNVQIWFQNRRAKDKSIKEHIMTETRKRQEEYEMQVYQRSNMQFLPHENPSITNFYPDHESTPHHEYSSNFCSGLNNNRSGYSSYDHKDAY